MECVLVYLNAGNHAKNTRVYLKTPNVTGSEKFLR